MKLNLKAFVLAAGIVWGGVILLVSIANLISPEYAVGFLEVIASVYPGFTPFTGVGSVVIGTLYGFVDGSIGGLIFVWLYNALAK